MLESTTLFVEVLLPIPLAKVFTYRVPLEWNGLIKENIRVAVQFGAKKIYAGIILSINDTPPEGYSANYILDILDEEAIVSRIQIAFWKWIAEYYMCTLGEVMNTALPAGFKLKSESKVVLSPDYTNVLESEVLSDEEYLLLSFIEKKKIITLDELKKLSGIANILKYIKSLYMRGIVLLEEEVKERIKQKVSVYLTLTSLIEPTAWEEIINNLERKAKLQFNVIMHLYSNKVEVEQSLFIKEKNVSSAAIQSLIKKGLVIKTEKIEDRIPSLEIEIQEYTLNTDQQNAVDLSLKAFENEKVVLLNGVTGSGKTLVYIELIKSIINQGKQALYLLPEAAITEIQLARINKVLPNVGIWYSYFNEAEKAELYHKVLNGKIQVLIGARSAIFANFNNLGLIVIDEEHETGFKQFEKRPYYYAKDAALVLAKLLKANVILGSATPSFESLQNVIEGKFIEVNLNTPFFKREQPKIKIIDTNRYDKAKPTSILSLDLIKSMHFQIAQKRQIILFQNKRGYVPYISCDTCGFTDQCLQCDIALTYFKTMNLQRCGFCNTKYELVNLCKQCLSPNLSMKGYGTERIVEECELLFPQAKIARFDADSIRKRGDFNQIIEQFRNKTIDILIGTQLLSKGIDFVNVGLVGIVNMDSLLNSPQFRSSERTFQIVKQLIGRAGDESIHGEVIIQTQKPTHEVLEVLKANNYMQLFKTDMEMRKEFHYPPYSKLVIIRVKHIVYTDAMKGAGKLYQRLVNSLHNRVQIPYAPSVARVKNMYIVHINVKMDKVNDDFKKLKLYIQEQATQVIKEQTKLQIDFDVDPI